MLHGREIDRLRMELDSELTDRAVDALRVDRDVAAARDLALAALHSSR
jgi:hypothetical protein